MNVLTHMMLVEWEETAQHEEWDFPEEPLTEDFVIFAVDYVGFMRYLGRKPDGYHVDHFLPHAYDFFDDVIATTPRSWFYWLFQETHYALYPDWEYYAPKRDHEYLIQPSDHGGFEVYDLTDLRVIWLDPDYEEAQRWLDEYPATETEEE